MVGSIVFIAIIVTGFVVWQVLSRPRPASKVEWVIRQAPQAPEQQYVIEYAPTVPVAVERELEAARERPGSIYYTRSGRHTR